ncbi:hypothetical protein ABH922_000832 [Rhodococcus sp. 27YEA15]|uniref:hypothetical protein n=1 Tax=Rhodococcus sp. 27YEA15 TaxID=3156259 RepID=UPI003C7A0707
MPDTATRHPSLRSRVAYVAGAVAVTALVLLGAHAADPDRNQDISMGSTTTSAIVAGN